MAMTDTVANATWNNPMIKQIRKTLAVATLIMGSAAVAMILFGDSTGGGSLVSSANRAIRNVFSWIGGVDPIIIGVAVFGALMVGIAFWVRGR